MKDSDNDLSSVALRDMDGRELERDEVTSVECDFFVNEAD